MFAAAVVARRTLTA